MATRTKKPRRPAKKAPAKKNSRIGEAQSKAVERRLERSEKSRERAAAYNGGSPSRGTGPKPAELKAPSGQPMANRGAGIPRDEIADRDRKGSGDIDPKSLAEATKKIAGLSTGLVAERTAEKRALADTSLYGTPDKDIKARITAQQNARYAAQQAKAKKAGKAVYMGPVKRQVRRARGQGNPDFEGGVNRSGLVTETVDVDNITTKDELLGWLADETKVEQIKQAAIKAGIAVETYDDIAKLWGSVVSQAASSFSSNGQKVTPWALIQLRGKYMGADGKPKTKVTTSTSIDEMDPATARLMFERTASEQLGRTATKQEIDDFIAKAQTIARENPAVTTTQSKLGFDGNIESQVSRTVGGGQAVSDQAQVAAMDQAKQSEDYAAFQAAGNYFPMLFEALQSPV